MSDETRADGAGAALGGKGSPCPTVQFWGRTWKIGWPTQEAKQCHEILVAQHAEAELESRRALYTPAKMAVKERALELQLNAGDHRVYGSLWSATVDGPDGMPLFLLSLLREHHPNATIEEARALWSSGSLSVRLAMAQVMPPFAVLLVSLSPRIQEADRPVKAMELTAAFLELVGPLPQENATVSPPTASDAPTG